MATTGDLFRLNTILPELARQVLGVATDKFVGQKWRAVILDARYFADGSGILDKTRVELPDKTLGSVARTAEIGQLLRELGDLRPEGKDRWYGLLLRITVEGDCDTAFNYDPHCAEDDSFYDV